MSLTRIPFDQFQRYKTAANLIENLRKNNKELSILEVGANEHQNLEKFLPTDRITYLDIEVPQEKKMLPNYIEGDATKMEFSDNSFDIVVALDVFEHIPANKRKDFLKELYRVSKDFAIISAPFFNIEVEQAEKRVNELFKTLHGKGFRWLEEHRENGLPSIDETKCILAEMKANFINFEHGYIDTWEKIMHLHFLSTAMPFLEVYRESADYIYNQYIYEYDFQKPGYRHFFVFSKEEIVPDILDKYTLSNEHQNHLYKYYNKLDNILKHADSVATLHESKLNTKNRLERDTLQIFWADSDNQNFSEENSVKLEYNPSDYFQEFTFDLIIGEKSNIVRIDPSVKYGVILEIEDIKIKFNNNNGDEIELNYSLNKLLYKDIYVIESNSNSYVFATLTSDPQIFLDLSNIDLPLNNMKVNIILSLKKVSSDNLILYKQYNKIVYTNQQLSDTINFQNDKLDLILNTQSVEFNKIIGRINELENTVADNYNNHSLENKKIIDKLNELENNISDFDYIKNKTVLLDEKINNILENIDLVNSNILNNNLEFQSKDNKIRSLEKQVEELKALAESMRIKNRIKSLFHFKKTKSFFEILSGIENKGDNQWISINDDPQFKLVCNLKPGWKVIKFIASCSQPLHMRIYFDFGQGYDEQNSIKLSTFHSEEKQICERFFYLPEGVKNLRFDPLQSEGEFYLSNLKIKDISRFKLVNKAVRNYFAANNFSFSSFLLLSKKFLSILKSGGLKAIWQKSKQHALGVQPDSLASINDYKVWQKLNDPSEQDLLKMKEDCKSFKYKPLISVILPVYNVEEIWLRKCIDSVRNQVYENWELCIADDNSPKEHIRPILEEYMKKDKRIKVVFRKQNGHISEASNSAIEIAKGEFIALLDHDDELAPHALYENVKLLNKHPDADMIYSDEDKISESGERHTPFFKPDWSPDTILSMMYTCHLGVYRTSIVREIGGFRKGYEGSQDHDLVLRFTERTNKIFHIPKILYHWRTIAESTAANAGTKSYAHQAGLRAVTDAIMRRGEKAIVSSVGNYLGRYHVQYQVPSHQPLVTIIIPTKDKPELLRNCLNSIFEKTTYNNFEVIVVDNNSEEKETFDLFEYWNEKEPQRFRVLRMEIPFNYSKLNNAAAKIAKGELLLLLNNDIEVITPQWLERMAGQALRSSIGVVGAKLYYPDKTIQHAGVVLGIGGVAGHSHKYFNEYETGYFDRLIVNCNYSAVTGACLMVKKEVYEKVNGLDEKLEVAFNDVDFCLRVLKEGYYNIVLPDVLLYHYESKSRGHEDTPEKIARFNREIDFMKQRWGDFLLNDPFYNPNLTLDREDFSICLEKRNIQRVGS